MHKPEGSVQPVNYRAIRRRHASSRSYAVVVKGAFQRCKPRPAMAETLTCGRLIYKLPYLDGGSRMRTWFSLLFCVIGVLGLAGVVLPETKQVVGWAEKVRIFPGNLVLHAKMDTGADNCSLHVPDFTLFERNGEQWIRFEVTNHRRRQRNARTSSRAHSKDKTALGRRQERPVVLLNICLGNIVREAEVNLVDRGRFKFRMLIGRSFMGDRISVILSVEYTVEPDCPGMGER